MPEFNENPRPRPPDPYEGRVIDKYMLISKLGTGGMGLVYRAEQLRIKRQVAIKLLSAKLIHDQVNVKRIEREAAAMGNLRHPNIATFHDFGISDGQPYLVMELIAGRSLGDLLDEQKRLDPDRVITIAAQVADAMAYAHKQGLVHRDLKPDNIMLDNEHTNDFAKVLDFGIAKTAEDLSLTKSGVLIGSPLYMSPEQCRGGKLDSRSDIYSLGVIIYEALTGLVPCKGETLIETLSRKTMEEAPPFPPEFSEWKDLERLTLACLAMEPDDRPQSMTIVRDELFGLLNPGAVSMSMSSLQQRSRNPRASGTNAALGQAGQRQFQGGQNHDSSQSQVGGSTQGQSRIGARRPARTTQSQSRTDTGRLTQNQTRSQLQGYPPVLDETGQTYKPLISSKQMIVIGTAIGVMYLMSVVAVAAWFVGFDEGNGPKSLFGGTSSQASSKGSGAVDGIVGRWKAAGSGTIFEVFQDGSYKSTANGVTIEAGKISAANGKWNLRADSGRVDSGSFTLNGGDLQLKGAIVTTAWNRLASPTSEGNNSQATANGNGTASGSNTTPPAPERSTASNEVQPVKTVQAKPKRPKRATESLHSNRYSSTPSASNSQLPSNNYRSRYSNQNASNRSSNYGSPEDASSSYVLNARNNRVNRHAQQAEEDRRVREHLKATLEAAAEQRAAAAERANRRFNDIDAVRKQYGGGSQWGKDTGSSYYGNGNF